MASADREKRKRPRIEKPRTLKLMSKDKQHNRVVNFGIDNQNGGLKDVNANML